MGDFYSRWCDMVVEDKFVVLNYFLLGDIVIWINLLYGCGCFFVVVSVVFIWDVLDIILDLNVWVIVYYDCFYKEFCFYYFV